MRNQTTGFVLTPEEVKYLARVQGRFSPLLRDILLKENQLKLDRIARTEEALRAKQYYASKKLGDRIFLKLFGGY